MGHTLFKNMKLIENRLGGVIVHKTNFTTEAYPVMIQDMLIVGHSTDNDHGMDAYHADEKQAGVILPFTDEIVVKNVVFANFEKNNTNCFEASALSDNGDFMTTGGHTYEIENIKYVGSINQKVRWGRYKTDIIHDIDGTVSGKNVESYITPSMPHLKAHSGCEEITDKYEVPVVVCDNTA